MEDAESRFLHLLQPIRDLTKNWEVDVAAQLGEYLEELDQICISFDGGRTTMNFTEAALLIQGSACIYSRKVEYLYSLVYQALDLISNKKREKQPSSIGQDGKDADADFGTEEEEFLSLDDLRDTSPASVDMRRDQQPQTVDIVPLTPMALVPPEEAEKRNNPLFSRKGELLASRKDFRVNTCTPHASGAFMLELAGLSPTRFSRDAARALLPWWVLWDRELPLRRVLWDRELPPPWRVLWDGELPPLQVPWDGELPPPWRVLWDRELPPPWRVLWDGELPPPWRVLWDGELPPLQVPLGGELPPPWRVLWDGELPPPWRVLRQDAVRGPGGGAGADDDGGCQDDARVAPEDSAAPAAGGHVQLQRVGLAAAPRSAGRCRLLTALLCARQCAAQPGGYGLRARAPAQDPGARGEELLDPWQSLDPFGDSEDKPFKKGRPFAVPRGLDEVPGSKRRRRGPRKLQDFMKWFSAAYNSVAEGTKARRRGPTFADLELLYWQQLKRRFAAQRRLQQRPQWEPEPLDALEEERGAGDADEDEDGADAFEEHEEILAEAPEELVEGALEPCALDALSYEELVRRNVELFMATSQKYAQETLLSRRIREWEERTAPLLQEQEQRAAFDIHGYGDELVGALGALGAWRPFSSLVAGRAPFEVCRYMLAALQLANDRTVEMSEEPPLAVDTVRLRLLTRERAHERFRAAPAP
ncbi:condensin-2 complex subunit H2 [Eudromia elegans]